jgi:hypothetical protein
MDAAATIGALSLGIMAVWALREEESASRLLQERRDAEETLVAAIEGMDAVTNTMCAVDDALTSFRPATIRPGVDGEDIARRLDSVIGRRHAARKRKEGFARILRMRDIVDRSHSALADDRPELVLALADTFAAEAQHASSIYERAARHLESDVSRPLFANDAQPPFADPPFASATLASPGLVLLWRGGGGGAIFAAIFKSIGSAARVAGKAAAKAAKIAAKASAKAAKVGAKLAYKGAKMGAKLAAKGAKSVAKSVSKAATKSSQSSSSQMVTHTDTPRSNMLLKSGDNEEDVNALGPGDRPDADRPDADRPDADQPDAEDSPDSEGHDSQPSDDAPVRDMTRLRESMQKLTKHCVMALRDPRAVADSVACTEEMVDLERAMRGGYRRT